MSDTVGANPGGFWSWNTFHTTMDVLGMVPVVGEVFDVANGITYAARGDKFNAAISFAGAMAPLGGQAITGARIAVKYSDEALTATRQAGDFVATNARAGNRALDTGTGSSSASQVLARQADATPTPRVADAGGPPNSGTPNVTPESVDLQLKYKEGWSADQRLAADAKCQALCEADTVVRQTPRSGTSASSRYKRDGNTVPKGNDVDHTHELQLGGSDTLDNMLPLDSSVNRSVGSQIRHQIKDLPVGTPVGNVSIY